MNEQIINHIYNLSLQSQRSLKKLADSPKGGYVFCRSDKDGEYQRGFKKVVNQEVHKDRMETINSGNKQLMVGCIKSDIEETTKKLHGGGHRGHCCFWIMGVWIMKMSLRWIMDTGMCGY